MNKGTRRPVETPRVWRRYATENLEVARHEMTQEMPAYHTVCFLCQSAAEKYLKGYLIARGWELRRTHDILELLEFCSGYAPEFAALASSCAVLNEYITEGRYPGDIPFEAIGAAEAQEALEIAERIRKVVERLI